MAEACIREWNDEAYVVDDVVVGIAIFQTIEAGNIYDFVSNGATKANPLPPRP
jgi:hypothetical protein